MQMNSDGAMTKNKTCISTASAMVSVATSIKNFSTRKAFPMSIASRDTAGTTRLGAENVVLVEFRSSQPDRTPEFVVLTSEQNTLVRPESCEPSSQEEAGQNKFEAW